MTVTTNEYGQQNMFAKEPQMYVSKTDAERYGYETYAERAEKLNGRTAMLGFIAAVVSYATSGSVFFFGAFRLRSSSSSSLMSSSLSLLSAIFFFLPFMLRRTTEPPDI